MHVYQLILEIPTTHLKYLHNRCYTFIENYRNEKEVVTDEGSLAGFTTRSSDVFTLSNYFC